jgi:hypothetical protein
MFDQTENAKQFVKTVGALTAGQFRCKVFSNGFQCLRGEYHDGNHEYGIDPAALHDAAEAEAQREDAGEKTEYLPDRGANPTDATAGHPTTHPSHREDVAAPQTGEAQKIAADIEAAHAKYHTIAERIAYNQGVLDGMDKAQKIYAPVAKELKGERRMT